MNTTKPSVGFLADFARHPDRHDDASKFMVAGCEVVKKREPLTLQWYGFYNPATDVFSAFDAFANEEGRKQHATSDDFKALAATAGELMAPAPVINEIDILESMVRPSAQVKLGLVVSFDCKPGKVDEVKEFLVNTAYTLVQTEEATLSWYAVHYPGTNKFAILDFFSAEDGRQTHLDGQIPLAFETVAGELLEDEPVITKIDIVAAKI